MGFKDGASLAKVFFTSRKLEDALRPLETGQCLVDASGILHAVLSKYATEVMRGSWFQFDAEVASRLANWKTACEHVEPVFVFDGHRCHAKIENANRKRERAQAAEAVDGLRALISGLQAQAGVFEAAEDAPLEEEAGDELDRDAFSAAAAAFSSSLSSAPAPPASTSDIEAQYRQCTASLAAAMQKLKRSQCAAVGARAQEAAYRMLRMCDEHGVKAIVAAGEAEHTIAGLFGLSTWHPSAELAKVVAACGYDSDFFVLRCAFVLYGQGLQGVLGCLSWSTAEIAVRKKRFFAFNHIKNDKDRTCLTSAMQKYGVERVIQLTALFSDNDYVKYRGVGAVTLAQVWGDMLLLGVLNATLCQFAKCLAAKMLRASGTASAAAREKREEEYISKAERAAIMYFGQPIITPQGDLYLPPLPDFVEGCQSCLFAAAPVSGHHAVGAPSPYTLRNHDRDKDVLELFDFFNAMSPDDVKRWAAGGIDVSSLDAKNLIAAPEPEATSAYSAKVVRPEDVIEALSREQLKRMARRFAISVTGLSEAELQAHVKTAIALHFDAMADDTLRERALFQGAYVDKVNAAKHALSVRTRREISKEQSLVVDLAEVQDEMSSYFECPQVVLNTYEMLLDDDPSGVINSRRESEARLRTVHLDKVAVCKQDYNKGYVVARVQKTIKIDTFYDVVIKVQLEDVDTTAETACKDRLIKLITGAVCLLPAGLVNAQGQANRGPNGNLAPNVKAAKLCFGGEYCIHIAAVVRSLHLASAPSTTDRPSYWGIRVSNRLSQDASTATKAPFVHVLHGLIGEAAEGQALSLLNFNPVPWRFRRLIKEGIEPHHGNRVSRRRFLNYRKVKCKTLGVLALRNDVVTQPGPALPEGLEHLPRARLYGRVATPPDEPLPAEGDVDDGGDAQSSVGSASVIEISAAQVAARMAALTGAVAAATPHTASGAAASHAAIAASVPDGTGAVAAHATASAAASDTDEDRMDTMSDVSSACAPHSGDDDDAMDAVLDASVTTQPALQAIGAETGAAPQTASAAEQPFPKKAKATSRRKTRSVTKKDATRGQHCCVCPLGAKCTANRPRDAKSGRRGWRAGVPTWRYLRRASSLTEKALRRLGWKKAKDIQRLKQRPGRLPVNPGHYEEGAFWNTKRGWEFGAPTVELPSPSRQVAVELDLAKLIAADEKFHGYNDNCVCRHANCNRRLDETNSVRLWRGKTGISEEEVKLLRHGQSKIENDRLKAFGGRHRQLKIDVRHFDEAHFTRASNGSCSRKRGYIAKYMHPISHLARPSPEERETLHAGRRHLAELGIPVCTLEATDTFSLGQSLQGLKNQVASFERQLFNLQSQLEKEVSLTLAIPKTILHHLEHTPADCNAWTGEPSFECLTLLYEYLNAHDVLENLQYWIHGATQLVRQSNAGRPRTLTPFECFVLFMMRLRCGRHATRNFLRVCFNVSRSTIERVYQTFLRAVVYILSAHQPWPSEEALRWNTDDSTRRALGLVPHTIVVYGDATERRVYRPRLLGGVLYSEYKAYESLKYNIVVTDGGYILEISYGYSGKTSDNMLHAVDFIAQRIGMACGKKFKAVYVYDKGLQCHRIFADNNVLLLRPYGKEVGQIATSAKDARVNRSIASKRVITENVFADCRDYKSFDDKIRLGSIIQHDLEANAARCMANLRARRGGPAEAQQAHEAHAAAAGEGPPQ